MADEDCPSHISDLILTNRWPYTTTKLEFDPVAFAQARRIRRSSDIAHLILTARWVHVAAANRTFGIYELTKKILLNVREPATLFAMQGWNRLCYRLINDTLEIRQTMLLESSATLPMFRLVKMIDSDALRRAMHPFGIHSLHTKTHGHCFSGLRVAPGSVLVVTIGAPDPAMVKSRGSWRDVRVEYPGGKVVVSLFTIVDGEQREIIIRMGERTTLGRIVTACENRTVRDCRLVVEDSAWEEMCEKAELEELEEEGKYEAAWVKWVREHV